ncbi:MAG TPA: exodeoxyribonuclease VII large subunit [Candidatus Tyrphobacter sp.]
MSEAERVPPRPVYSVGEFTRRMAGLFARTPSLCDIAISGEVSGLREFNGHLGFTLKEERAVLDCVAWSDVRRGFPQLENGMAVIAAGKVDVRPDRSAYQLVVESIEPTGLGKFLQLYEELKMKFRAEGLFEASRKRKVPELPRHVALISARGKGMEDFLETIARRAPFVEVTFIETKVQGQGAEIEIAAAVDRASGLHVDVIVITRGGGSYEDLFPFNLEPVVRAIVRAHRPVLTAIGHSGDHHLADDVADLTFGTPSLAAEHIARGWLLARERLIVAQRDLARAVRDAVGRAAQRANALAESLAYRASAFLTSKRGSLAEGNQRLDRHNPERFVSERRARLAQISGSLETGAVRFFAGIRQRVERASALLDGLDPLRPLAHGYAIVTKHGKAVRDAADLTAGDPIQARFERGVVDARVESVQPDA